MLLQGATVEHIGLGTNMTSAVLLQGATVELIGLGASMTRAAVSKVQQVHNGLPSCTLVREVCRLQDMLKTGMANRLWAALNECSVRATFQMK